MSDVDLICDQCGTALRISPWNSETTISFCPNEHCPKSRVPVQKMKYIPNNNVDSSPYARYRPIGPVTPQTVRTHHFDSGTIPFPRSPRIPKTPAEHTDKAIKALFQDDLLIGIFKHKKGRPQVWGVSKFRNGSQNPPVQAAPKPLTPEQIRERLVQYYEKIQEAR